MVDVANLDAGIANHVLKWRLATLKQISSHCLELCTRHSLIEEERVLLSINSDVRQVHAGLL